MNIKAKKVSKFFVVLFVFLLSLALVLGSTGAYYSARRSASGTVHLQNGIKIDYTGFSGSDQEWTSANATSFLLFNERDAIPGEEIELVGTSIRANQDSVDFYARAKIEYAFDGTYGGNQVSDIQDIAGIESYFEAEDLITADVFNSNWKESSTDDGWFYFVSGHSYGKFTATDTAYKNIFKSEAKLMIEGVNFTGAEGNGSGGGFVVEGTEYVITTIRASLVLEFIQAKRDAATDFGWDYVEPGYTPAPAEYNDQGVLYTLNNEGNAYTVTGGTITGNNDQSSVSGYSAQIGNSSVNAYESSYSYRILSYICGLPVTKIASNAFSGANGYYVYIIIPTTIVRIGDDAFAALFTSGMTITFDTERLNTITIGDNAIPNGTTLPNGAEYTGTAVYNVPELYTLTLIDEKDNYDSFWSTFISENGYTYQGNGTYTIRLPYGTVGQLPAPTFDGFTFQYWYDEEDEMQLPANQDLTIEGDVTATAVYAENGQQLENYTVTIYVNSEYENHFKKISGWNYDGKAGYITKTFSEGSDVTFPTPNKYNNQTLLGHYDTNPNKTSNPQAFGSTKSNISSNWTYYFIYEGISGGSTEYTITLYDNKEMEDGYSITGAENYVSYNTFYIEQTVTSGTSVTLPTPSCNNYTFLYWDDNGSHYSGGESYTVTSDVTLTAVWESAPSTTYVYSESDLRNALNDTSVSSIKLGNNIYIYSTIRATIADRTVYIDGDGYSIVASQSGTLKDFALVFEAGYEFGTLNITDLTLTVQDGFRSGIMVKREAGRSNLSLSLSDVDITINHSSQPYRDKVAKNCVAIQNNSGSVSLYGNCTITIDAYCWAAIDLDNSNGYTYLELQHDASITFVAENKGSMYEALIKVNDNGKNGMSVSCLDQNLVETAYGYDYASTTYVYSESDFINALNDSTVSSITLASSFTITNIVRATISRELTINGAGYTITGTKGGQLKDYVLVFTSDDYGSVTFNNLNFVVSDGYRSAIKIQKDPGDITLTLIDTDITIAHNSQPYKDGNPKNCVAIQNNGSTLVLKGDCTITIDEYCWAAIDLDNSSANTTLTFYDGANITFVADNKGSMYEALVKVNDNGKNGMTVSGYSTQNLVETSCGYDYAAATYVYSESDLRNALNDTSVSSIALGSDIYIYSTIRATVSERSVTIKGNGYEIYASQSGTLKDYAFVFTSDTDGSVTFNNVGLYVNDGFRSGIMIKKDSGNISLTLKDSNITINHSSQPYKDKVAKNCVAIQNNDSTLTLKGDCTITIDAYCWAAIDLDNSNAYTTLTFYEGANITFVANNKGSMYEALVKVNNHKNGMSITGYSAQNLVETSCGYDYDTSSSTEYTVTLAFSDSSLISTNFDSSVFKGWEATYKASPTGYTRTVAAGTKITLPDDGKYTGYVWSDGKNTYEPGDSYTVNGNITFTYQPEGGSSGTEYTVTLRFADTKYMSNFDGKAFDDWTEDYDKNNNLIGYHMDVTSGTKITLPKDNYDSYAWNDGKTDYDPGESYTVNGSIKFTYQSGNGGSSSTQYQISLTDSTGFDKMTMGALGWTMMTSTYCYKNVNSGTVVTLPNLTRDGYTFNGWSYMGTRYPGGTSWTVTGDINFSAVWKNDNGNTITIKNVNSSFSTWMMQYSNIDGWTYGYDMMGMPPGPKLYKTAQGAITLPTPQPFQYNGQTYYFNYFSTSQYDMMMMGTHYLSGQEITPTNDITLYAYFTAANTITLYNALDTETGHEWNFADEFTSSGTHTYTKTATASSSVTLPSPTLDGYTFAYWQDQDGNRYAAGTSFLVTVDATFTAVWVQGTAYTVTLDMTAEDGHEEYVYNKINWAAAGFYASNEQGIYKQIVSDGAVVTLPTSGWYIGSWVNSADSTDSQTLGAQITADADVAYAFEYQGDITRYQLTIDFNEDYNYDGNNDSTYNYNSPSNYFDITGLGSWSGSYIYYEDGEGAVLTLPTAITYNNRIISGYFIASDSYDNNGTRYELGDTITLNDNITLYFHSDGYTAYYQISLYFSGHYDAVSAYIDNTWTIEYDGGDPYRAYKYVESGTTITLPNSNNEGAAWGDYEPGSEYTVDYEMSFWLQIKSFYTAKLVLGEYAAHVVSLDGWTDGGNGTYTKRVKEGVSFYLPAFDNSDSYRWKVGNNDYYNSNSQTSIWENRTFTLVYITSYTATLHLNGENFDTTSGWWGENGSKFTNNGDGTYSRSFTVVDGWGLPDSTSYFNLSGDVFYGWYSDPELTQSVDSWSWYRNATGNLDFYAKFGPQNVTLKFNLNGGTTDWWELTNNMSYDDGEGVYVWSVNYNNSFNLPTLTKEGYTFVGFFDNSSFTGQNWNEGRQRPNSNETTTSVYPKDFASGTTFYAKFLENYVENNMIFAWDAAAEEWTIVGVTEYFDLETLTIPSSVTGNGHTGNVTKIGADAFAGSKDRGGDSRNYSFNTVVIPNTVVEIGSCAFYENKGLTTVTFAENSSLRVIGMSAFEESYITSFTIPASVEEIRKDAFDDCDYLPGITVDENNQVYSSYYGVVYNKAQTQIKIMSRGFTGVDGTLRIPATVTVIDGVLEGSFTHLVFEGDVTIENKGVQYRGDDYQWLAGVYYLKIITFTNTDPATLGDVADSGFYGDLLIFVPVGCVEAYQTFFDENSDKDCTWTAIEVGADISPTNTALDGVEYDSENDVYTYTDARGIVYTLNKDGQTYTITDATKADLSVDESKNREESALNLYYAGPFGLYLITAIGEEAFSGITDKYNIRFSDLIQTIEDRAFYNATGLSVSTDIRAATVGEYAFYGCNIKELDIYARDNNITICAHAFDGAVIEYSEIHFEGKGSNTITIGEYAFANITYKWGGDIYVYLGDDDHPNVSVVISEHAFDGMNINSIDVEVSVTLETNALAGATIGSIRIESGGYLSGLADSGVDSNTTVYDNH